MHCENEIWLILWVDIFLRVDVQYTPQQHSVPQTGATNTNAQPEYHSDNLFPSDLWGAIQFFEPNVTYGSYKHEEIGVSEKRDFGIVMLRREDDSSTASKKWMAITPFFFWLTTSFGPSFPGNCFIDWLVLYLGGRRSGMVIKIKQISIAMGPNDSLLNILCDNVILSFPHLRGQAQERPNEKGLLSIQTRASVQSRTNLFSSIVVGKRQTYFSWFVKLM